MSVEDKSVEVKMLLMGGRKAGTTTLSIRFWGGKFDPQPNFDNYEAAYFFTRKIGQTTCRVEALGLLIF